MSASSSPGPSAKPPEAATLAVWAQPGASREGVAGMMGDAVKIALTAPPEKGKANKALERFLSREFGVSASSVAVVSGGSSKRKIVRLAGVSAAQAATWVQRQAAGKTPS